MSSDVPHARVLGTEQALTVVPLPPQVRGYRTLKLGLQRRLAEIEHERKNAHFKLPEMTGIVNDMLRYKNRKCVSRTFGQRERERATVVLSTGCLSQIYKCRSCRL